jgi:hypothetical protein
MSDHSFGVSGGHTEKVEHGGVGVKDTSATKPVNIWPGLRLPFTPKPPCFLKPC